jgi:hypothetical protein
VALGEPQGHSSRQGRKIRRLVSRKLRQLPGGSFERGGFGLSDENATSAVQVIRPDGRIRAHTEEHYNGRIA